MPINELSNNTVVRNERRRLLFVGNDCDGITGIKKHLVESGWSLKSCGSPDEAISTLESAEFGVLIIDLDMPGSSGLDIARRVRWSTHDTLVILVSDRPWDHLFEHHHEMAPHLFFHKPLDPKILEKALLTVQAVQFRAAVEDLQKCPDSRQPFSVPRYCNSTTNSPQSFEETIDEGIRALLNGERAIAVATRKMRTKEIQEAEERGIEIQGAVIDWIGIAVAVHPTNPIDALTLDQLRQILAGKYARWSQVGGADHRICVVTIGNRRPRMTEYLVDTSVGNRLTEPARHLLNQPNGLALVPFEETESESGLKIVAIKRDEQSPAILPSRETMTRGTYPLRQPVHLYVDWSNSTDTAKAFFNFYADQASRAACEWMTQR